METVGLGLNFVVLLWLVISVFVLVLGCWILMIS